MIEQSGEHVDDSANGAGAKTAAEGGERGPGSGRRAPTITKDNAAEIGRRGGEAKARKAKERKLFGDVLAALLERKVTEKQADDWLRQSGYLPPIQPGKKPTAASHRVLVIAHMIDLCERADDPKLATAAVRAFEALAAVEGGKLGALPEDKGEADERYGVAVVPQVDGSLLGEMPRETGASGAGDGQERDGAGGSA